MRAGPIIRENLRELLGNGRKGTCDCVGENGHPEAAIIPWSVFLEIQRLLGDGDDGEATPDELEAMREAEADRKAGNMNAFIDLEDLKADLPL